MSDNNGARSARNEQDHLDENDPLAQLARLIEFDEPSNGGSATQVDSDFSSNNIVKLADDVVSTSEGFSTSPALDLEGELLAEFERYDASHDVSEADTAAAVQVVEPLDDVELETTAFEADGALEPDAGDLEDGAFDIESAFSQAASEVEAEASFEGPVPDFDFGSDASFDGPVPDVASDADASFDGPVPDFDFGAEFPSASGSDILDSFGIDEGSLSADEMLAEELEASLAIEKEPPAQSEPVTAFAEWKAERLVPHDDGLTSVVAPGWVAGPVLRTSEGVVATDDSVPEAAPETIVHNAANDVRAEDSEQEAALDPFWELQQVMAAAPQAEVSAPVAASEIDATIDDSELTFDLDSIADELSDIEDPLADDEVFAQIAGMGVPSSEAVPFDTSLIGEVDTQVETTAELRVPELGVEQEEPEMPTTSEFDFDIDSEMATLLHGSELPAASVQADETKDSLVDADNDSFGIDEKFFNENGLDEFEQALDNEVRSANGWSENAFTRNEQAGAEDVSFADAEKNGFDWRRMIAGVAAVLLVGGGAYAFFAQSGEGELGVGSGNEPRIILAENEPIKEAPEDPGGSNVPNQDKAVYDKVAGDDNPGPQQESLISSDEAPVDVVQRTLVPEALPLEGDEGTSEPLVEDRLLPDDGSNVADNSATAVPGGIPPRKVKTMIVLADGSLVAREEPAVEPEAVSSNLDDNTVPLTEPVNGVASELKTDEAAPEPISEESVKQEIRISPASDGADVNQNNAIADVANVKVEETAPVRSVRTTTVTPVPESRPAEQPVNIVGVAGDTAKTEPAAQSKTEQPVAAPAETQVASLPAGTYVMQIASLPSQAEAERAYKNLSTRFASVIGGRGVDIRRADIPNKGVYYRVRVPVGTRAEAIQLCERYKGAGGSCLVSK